MYDWLINFTSKHGAIKKDRHSMRLSSEKLHLTFEYLQIIYAYSGLTKYLIASHFIVLVKTCLLSKSLHFQLR